MQKIPCLFGDYFSPTTLFYFLSNQQRQPTRRKEMLFPFLSPDLCARLARDEFGNPNPNRRSNKSLDNEICESLIGTTYEVASELWNMIDPVGKVAAGDTTFNGAHPKHLFWSLFFLKQYCVESVMVRVFHHVDPKTLRKWIWIFVPAIADLKPRVVSNLFASTFQSRSILNTLFCIATFSDCFRAAV